MSKLIVVNNPLITHKLTCIRNEKTKTKDFYKNVQEIGSLMTYEFSKDFPVKDIEIQTPICKTIQKELAKNIVIVPILRAGLGMVDGIRNMIPDAKVGVVGLYRDEKTLKPHEYYVKLPKETPSSIVILVDPMLATGGSAIAACDLLKSKGAKKIIFVGLVAAPEGVKALQKLHPDVDIYTASLDEKLDKNGYIVPGLGDCGDRTFGTI